MTELEYWLYLAHVQGLESRRIAMLLQIFDDPSEVFKAKREYLEQVMFLEEYHINQLVNGRSIDYSAELERFKNDGIKFVTINDSIYPEKLRNIPDSPYFLFYKGELPDNNKPSVAIIGSRKCSPYGLEVGRSFAKALSECGVEIISGMAAGVDGCSHRGALEAKAKTYGVLGCGVDVCFPAENRDIYMAMQNQGGVISEYYPGQQPLPYYFPLRNRIISGLSDCVLVVEARRKSGTSITVGQALEQGREVFAIPGRIGDHISDGCNEMIKNGARIATEPADILEELKSQYEMLLADEKKKKSRKIVFDNELEKKVYEALDIKARHLSEVAEICKIPAEQLSVILVGLELKDYVSEVGKNMYIKRMR